MTTGCRRAAGCAALLLVLAPALAHAQQRDTASGVVRRRTAAEDLQLFTQVLNQIRVNHPDTLNTSELYLAAIEGMVRAADPHSYVIPSTRLSPEKEKAWRDGKLVEVPIDFRFVGGAAVVGSVAPGSQAAQLDILPGDELVAIDGRAVAARSEGELAVLLAGSKGSTVELSFERRLLDGSYTTFVRAVKRERVDPESAVPVAMMLDADVGYVRVVTFAGDDVAKHVDAALRALDREGMQRLILDLRDNGGGRVDQAASVAGVFLPNGSVIYSAEGRKPELAAVEKVRRAFRRERDYPMVVLINAGTASAAELVAGALQDHDRALIVGRPSFGKALMMHMQPLTDGSLLMLVSGHVKTPCGRVVQRQYRELATREYYRRARTDRDTTGLPTCTSTNGRVLRGGGGIQPDVILAEGEPRPPWLDRASALSLPIQWAAGYLTANPSLLTTPEAFAEQPQLPAAAIADFRAFAERQEVRIPAGAAEDALLEHVLVRTLAASRWGSKGYYRVGARLDPELVEARRALDTLPDSLAPKR